MLHPKDIFNAKIKKRFGISIEEARCFLNEKRTKIGLSKVDYFDKELKLDRTHELVFACISIQKSLTVKRILEFGTYSGESTMTLRSLFPEAEITTIDQADPILTITDKPELITNIERANANLIISNSLFLESTQLGRNDLIWIDGDHLYPTILMDIMNSFKSVTEDGYIMMDDLCRKWSVVMYLKSKYHSNDSWKALSYLRRSFSFNTLFFPKKISLSQYVPGRNRLFGLIEQVRSIEQESSTESDQL